MVNMGPGAVTPDREVITTVPSAVSIKALRVVLVISSIIPLNRTWLEFIILMDYTVW